MNCIVVVVFGIDVGLNLGDGMCFYVNFVSIVLLGNGSVLL